MASEIWQNTATQIAADIRNKKVTSRQVVEAHLCGHHPHQCTSRSPLQSQWSFHQPQAHVRIV